MNSRHKTYFSIAAGLILASNATAVDTKLQLLYPGSGWGQNVSVSYKATDSDPYTTISGWAGAFNAKYVSGSHLPTPVSSSVNPDNFYTFCTDVGATFEWGKSYNFTPESFTGQDGVNPDWTPNGVNWAAYLFNTFLPGAATAAQKAGLQIAIWEVLYDTARDLTTGRFRLNSGPSSAANSYLSSLASVSLSEAQLYDSTWLHLNPETQNGYFVQGLLYPDTTAALPPPVPDAGSTLVLLGLATAGLAAAGRRFRKE